jgi:hypothetical protein
MLDLARWVRFRWRLHPRLAVADTKYGTRLNILGLEQDGIRAYLGLLENRTHPKVFGHDRFRYDAQNDQYLCPAGQILRLSSFDRKSESFKYRAPARTCNACPLKSQCTASSIGRTLKRRVSQDGLDRVRDYQATSDFQRAQRKRAVWVEPMFGEAKQWHHLDQFRLRRLHKVNTQALLVAAGQNIKRLLKFQYPDYHPHAPAIAGAAQACSCLSLCSPISLSA